jgi:hypothetical protein
VAETPATRRHFLRTGALAAGTVWAAPTVRSVRVLQAPGTPPSSSSTSTSTPSTTFTFEDSGFEETVPPEQHPRCTSSAVFRVQFRADFVELGEGEVTILACTVIVTGTEAELRDGLVTVVLAAGALSGTGSGFIFLERLPTPLPEFRVFTQLDIEFTGGTGAFIGATGNATYGRVEDPFPLPTGTTTNRFAGSITVPGA